MYDDRRLRIYTIFSSQINMSAVNVNDFHLEGKTVIVTGANTGIGKETARELARTGARVILACRDRARADAARDDIVGDTNNENVVVKILDLGSLRSVKEFADDINENEERIDILVNNAGIYSRNRRETEDGFEMTFGVNHLAHFYLTNLLLDKIKLSAPSRIVIVSSAGHKYNEISVKHPQGRGRYNAMSAYNASKTANILHCAQLAKLLEGTGVSVYSLHPGAIKTEITRDYGASCLVGIFWSVLMPILGEKVISVEEGAKTTLYCCLEPSIDDHSGRYYVKCKETSAKRYATKPKTAQKLWDISRQMCDSAVASSSTPFHATI